jgi:hypothetical protein
MHVSLDTIADSIGLTTQEKSHLAELEGIVETHLEAFLAVGRALAEIRSRRLYRQDFATWEDYCMRRWSISYGRANDLIRSTEVAEHLLSGPAAPGGDAPLPDDLSTETLKSLHKLEPPLQSACWRLATRITSRPTARVISRIVRTVQHAVHQGSNGGSETNPKLPQSQKKIFLLSLHRLAESRVPACVIVQGIDETKARKHLEVAQMLISRCHEIVEAIRREFPQL